MLTPNHALITVIDYIAGFISNPQVYRLPEWQREDCWEDGYREQLIESVMMGIDLPKIYVGNIIGYGKVIIDGGHRTRALHAYITNKFSIKINGVSVFYSEKRRHGNRETTSRVMNEGEKETIDNYKLSICQYDPIEESMARNIFNKLQNTVPMSVADCVNSFESPIIDFLRNILQKNINGSTVKQNFKEVKSFPKPENSEDLYQLLSFATICWPFVSDNNQKESMKWIEKASTKRSLCYNYLKQFDNKNPEGITDEMESEYIAFLTSIIDILKGKPKMSSADMNTLAHSLKWVTNFSLEKFWTFTGEVKIYQTTKANSGKEFSKGEHDAGITLQNTAKEKDNNYDNKLSAWISSRTSGGSSEEGMIKRLSIVNKFCIKDEVEVEVEQRDNPPIQPMIPIQTVTGL